MNCIIMPTGIPFSAKFFPADNTNVILSHRFSRAIININESLGVTHSTRFNHGYVTFVVDGFFMVD